MEHKSTRLPYAGGLLLLICAIWTIVNTILSYTVEFFQYCETMNAWEAFLVTVFPAFFSILFSLPMEIPNMIMGIMLMRGKFGKAAVTCSVISAAWNLLMMLLMIGLQILNALLGVQMISATAWYYYFQIASFVAMAVVCILATFPSNPGKHIWYLPGVFAAVYFIGIVIANVIEFSKMDLPVWQLLKSFPYPALIVASFFLIGYWLRTHMHGSAAAKPQSF